MKGQLHDKVVIVTGGGTGIGEAVCRKFAREGARVVVNGLPDDPISDVVTAILDDGGTAIPFAGDVSDDMTRPRTHASRPPLTSTVGSTC
jgi:NAD(P)-dependent dehydrogenase (short-subunit alcohol dehydrogenase family)